MFVVVVTGPPGAGKTVALTALSDALVKDRVPHAAVDVDEVSWAYPFPSLAQRCDHLREWCTAHRRAGHDLLLVAEVIESPGHLGAVLASLSADDHLLVRLDATPATLRQRIIDREPPGWSSLAWLLEETPRLQFALAELDGVHLVIDSEQLTLHHASGAVRERRAVVARPRRATYGANRAALVTAVPDEERSQKGRRLAIANARLGPAERLDPIPVEHCSFEARATLRSRSRRLSNQTLWACRPAVAEGCWSTPRALRGVRQVEDWALGRDHTWGAPTVANGMRWVGLDVHVHAGTVAVFDDVMGGSRAGSTATRWKCSTCCARAARSGPRGL